VAAEPAPAIQIDRQSLDQLSAVRSVVIEQRAELLV
jgi:hypothetical protein